MDREYRNDSTSAPQKVLGFMANAVDVRRSNLRAEATRDSQVDADLFSRMPHYDIFSKLYGVERRDFDKHYPGNGPTPPGVA